MQASQPRSITVNGLQGVAAEFSAQSNQTALRGVAAFIQQGSNVYQLLGYGTQQSWSGNSAAVERAISSFAQVTDRSLLSVQPMRIDIITTDRAMTLAEFAQRNPGPATLEELVLLNQAESAQQQFPAGTRLKRLTGTRPPGS